MRGDAGGEVGDERGDADVAGATAREVGHDGFLEMNAMMTEMNAETMATGSVQKAYFRRDRIYWVVTSMPAACVARMQENP